MPRAASTDAAALPVHELLALEAVARLGSVQAAAEALSVTPSAVSHRIASLERRLGAPLLLRRGRGVRLSARAQACLVAVRPPLHDLAAATDALVADEGGVVRVACAAAVGAAWLLPRVTRYAARRRHVRFELLTVATADELPPDRWDLLLHHGPARAARAPRRTLFADRLIRVAPPPPARARSAGPPPARLRLAQLEPTAVADDARTDAGAGDDRPEFVFDDAPTMLEAAAAGAGEAWTTATAAAPHLAAGRVVRRGGGDRDGGAYTLELSEAGRLKPLAVDFHRWLLDDSARMGEPVPP